MKRSRRILSFHWDKHERKLHFNPPFRLSLKETRLVSLFIIGSGWLDKRLSWKWQPNYFILRYIFGGSISFTIALNSHPIWINVIRKSNIIFPPSTIPLLDRVWYAKVHFYESGDSTRGVLASLVELNCRCLFCRDDTRSPVIHRQMNFCNPLLSRPRPDITAHNGRVTILICYSSSSVHLPKCTLPFYRAYLSCK